MVCLTPGMKRDMGGAAGILGAFRTIALSKSTTNRVVAVLCLAENSVVRAPAPGMSAAPPPSLLALHGVGCDCTCTCGLA